jgi:hypothetical protein
VAAPPDRSLEGRFDDDTEDSPLPPQADEESEHDGGAEDAHPIDTTMEMVEPNDAYDDAFEPVDRPPSVVISPDDEDDVDSVGDELSPTLASAMQQLTWGGDTLLQDGPGIRGDCQAPCALPTTGEYHRFHDMIRVISQDTMHELLHGGFRDTVDQYVAPLLCCFACLSLTLFVQCNLGGGEGGWRLGIFFCFAVRVSWWDQLYGLKQIQNHHTTSVQSAFCFAPPPPAARTRTPQVSGD